MSDEDVEIIEGRERGSDGTDRQEPDGARSAPGPARRERAEGGADRDPREGAGPEVEPDVLLDVPTLQVDEIDLHVEDLEARVSLHADVLDLLRLDVGADVSLGSVELNIKGVEAEALLKVRLDSVLAAVERLLTSVDRNPQILERLTASLDSAVRDVGRAGAAGADALAGGAGRAVEGVTRTAERTAGELTRGARHTAEDVRGGARRTAEDAGGRAERTAGDARGRAGRTARRAEAHAARRDAARGASRDQDRRDGEGLSDAEPAEEDAPRARRRPRKPPE